MASSYPDPPANRLAYDRDGSVGFYIDASGVYQATTAMLVAHNNEAPDAGGSGSLWMYASETSRTSGLIFPQPRDIAAVCVIIVTFFASPNIAAIDTSTNTTYGGDGTWTRLATNFAATVSASASPDYRNDVVPLAANGIKAIRFVIQKATAQSFNAHTLHIYGAPSPGAAPDRTVIWHPTLDQPLSATPAWLDFGDTPRGTSEIRQFRVKNTSATKTATNTVVSVETLTDSSPSFPPQFLLSPDGAVYAPTVQIPTLGPGVITAPISMQRSTRADAALGPWAARVVSAPGTMS